VIAMPNGTVMLYGAPASYYTGKVRSYLRKNAIPFEERFPSHPHYREAIYPAVQNHRIPAVEFSDGAKVQDSTLILDECERRFPAVPRPEGALRVVELFVEAYADRALIKAAMHYRWNFPDDNRVFIHGEFGRAIAFAQGPDAWVQMGKMFAERMNAYLPPLGIAPETVPAIEASYLKFLDALSAHFREHPFVLGGAPSRADYGLMGPLYAHLCRDPYPLRLMQRKAPLVMRWVERMNAPERHAPEHPDRPAEFFKANEIPPTLTAVLRHAVGEYLPELEATARAFDQWLAKHPDAGRGSTISAKGEDQPSLGPIEYPFENVTMRQMSAAHTLWMIQHALDAYRASPKNTQDQARMIFDAAGGAGVLDLRLARRLTRINNKLAVE
jgi:glutathione S-transferase